MILDKVGVFPLRRHYYEPAFHPDDLQVDFDAKRKLPGVDLRETPQLALLENLDHRDEIEKFDWQGRQHTLHQYSDKDINFGLPDAAILHSFVRYFKPTRVIEIGSGSSTKVIHAALSMNQNDDGRRPAHICIEPYEMPWLEELGPVIIRQKVEECENKIFDELNEGDFLFIDSSHVIRPSGDVLFEYNYIFPRLPSGVFVHKHDIYTPREYPKTWVLDKRRFFNEQYVLEALLSADRYEVILSANHLHREHFSDLKKVCPYLEPSSNPGSFYIRVR